MREKFDRVLWNNIPLSVVGGRKERGVHPSIGVRDENHIPVVLGRRAPRGDLGRRCQATRTLFSPRNMGAVEQNAPCRPSACRYGF